MTIWPSWSQFAQDYDAGIPQGCCLRLGLAHVDAELLIRDLAAADRLCFATRLMDPLSLSRGHSVIGFDRDLSWTCLDGVAHIERKLPSGERHEERDADPVGSLHRLARTCTPLKLAPGLPANAAGLFGYIGYDFVRVIGLLPERADRARQHPDACLLRPGMVLVIDDVTGETTLVAAVWPQPDRPASSAFADAQKRLLAAQELIAAPRSSRVAAVQPGPPANATSDTDRAAFARMFQQAKATIAAGQAEQVGISRRFIAAATGSACDLFEALQRSNPAPLVFLLVTDALSLVGASPRALARVNDGDVSIEPVGGTRPRGATPEQDARYAEELLADPKETGEHQMLLDLAVSEVESVARAETVRVTKRMAIERFSQVMHLGSVVAGRLRDDCDAIDALVAAFPASTVVGVPKRTAIAAIEAIEPRPRGIYGGAVGYLGAQGSMEMYMTIRTAILYDGTLTVQAGASIVTDSKLEGEWQETANKARALLLAAGANLS